MKRPKKKKTGKKLLPQLKKDIKNFCFSEEGKISKKTVAKLGLTMAMLAASVNALEANHGSSTHSQATDPTKGVLFNDGTGNGHVSGIAITYTTHSSHPSHTSHGSHGQW